MADKDTEKVVAPEQAAQEEVQKRTKAFLEDYGVLVKKHNVDFASYPVFIPNGHGGFEVIVQNTPVDVANQPKKSPFMPG